MSQRRRFVEAFRTAAFSTDDEWLSSLLAVAAFIRTNDRLPSLTAKDSLTAKGSLEERRLRRWLNHQRREYRSRDLTQHRINQLDGALPRWRPAVSTTSERESSV